MKNLLGISLVVLIFALVFAAYAPAQTGGDLYKAKCAACHGPDGKGDTAMGKNLKLRDLASADVQGQSDGDLNTVITKGKNKMPAYDGKLTKEQIDSLVKHIRSLKK